MSANLQEEAVELVGRAEAAGGTLRLFGGVAVQLLVPNPVIRRIPPGDIDCAGLSRELPVLLALFASLGYEENLAVRRLFGTYRRVFKHPEKRVKVDLCLDTLLFSGRIDVRRRLTARPLTLSVADLILSKLQPKDITDKDAIDVLNLLSRFTPAQSETDLGFNLKWVLDPCGRDWGLYRLVRDNLDQILQASEQLRGTDQDRVRSTLQLVLRELELHPKCLWWRLRAVLGKRLAYWNEVTVED